MLGDTCYAYLEEEEPDSITKIQLAQVGVWLKLEGSISQFAYEGFMLGIEQRLAKLGKFDWLRFIDEITGLPDWVTIESEQEQHIFSQISAHLNNATDKGLEGSDEPIRTLRNALFSKRLQNEMCARFNEQALQMVKANITALGDHDDVLIGKRHEFLQCCQSLMKNWFAGANLPIPQLDKTGISPNSISQLSRWEDLTITFTSNDSVQIRIADQKPKTLSFVDLGFTDGRKGDRPNILWELLKGMAVLQGSIRYDHQLLNLKSRKATEKQIGRIREALKTYFSLDENPIKWKRYDGYRCIFTLKAADHLIDQWREDYSP